MRQLVAVCLMPLALALPHRGFNFTTWWHDEYATPHAARSLHQLAATGANSVALVPSWYQRSRRSTRIAPDAAEAPRTSPWPSSWRAQDLGLKVFLRPTVETRDGTPRAELRPRLRGAPGSAATAASCGTTRSSPESLGVDMLSVGFEYRSLDGPTMRAAGGG